MISTGRQPESLMSDHGLPRLAFAEMVKLDLWWDSNHHESAPSVLGLSRKSRGLVRIRLRTGPASAVGTHGQKLQLVSRFKEEGCQTNRVSGVTAP